MFTDVTQFYYSQTVPQNSVVIARVQTNQSSPASLVDIDNLVPSTAPSGSNLAPGAYTATGYPVAFVWNGLVLENAVAIQGSTTYLIQNQFFEITNLADSFGNPLFYRHLLPGDVTDVTVLNLDLTPATGFFMVQNNSVYHTMDGTAKWVKYYSNQLLHTELLQYAPVLAQATVTSPSAYIYSHSVIEVNDSGTYWIRWTDDSGYRVLPPYNMLSNDPWYGRVRFNPNPGAPEWATQIFMPLRPYQMAAWVPGTVIGPYIVEFERRPMLFDGSTYPDILVYDQNMNLKYAIDGSPVNSPLTKGYLFPWQRGQYAPNGLDPAKGRANLIVELDTTDVVFGFYFYVEPDIVYKELDLNPFTNPAVAGRAVQFLYNPNSTNPYQNVYHQMLLPDGAVDPDPSTTNNPNTGGTVFSTVMVGDSVSVADFTCTDARVRGGGLAADYQSIDQAANFWDLGYLDGKPYPLGGAAVVYLPVALLSPAGAYTRTDLQAIIGAVFPMGTIAVLRFYDPAGNESV